jgi:uncharacterized repeat protein (TIGR03803 family)
VAYNGSYSVTVGTQPTGQTCSVAANTGSGAGVVANVTNVSIACTTDTYTIGGSLSGLASGQQVTLQDNGGNPLTLTANGAFTFSTPVAYNGSYSVTVGTQPTGQTCSVAANTGSGSGVTANVTSVSIACSTNTFTIGGTLSGLAGGQQVTLNDNGGDPLTVTANGAFTFATPVAYNGSYSVTVSTQPLGQSCAVTGGSGASVSSNVSSVQVACGSRLSTLYNFGGFSPGDGQTPQGALISDSSGNVYGTTVSGGAFGLGTVFELSPSGAGYTERVLYSFGSTGADGTNPAAGLIMDASGNLYGTTVNGGVGNFGTVFELSPNGSGGYTESILFNFNGVSGASPEGSLIRDASGNLYGTTYSGGFSNVGTVFKLSPPSGGSTWTVTLLYDFSGPDGSNPYAGLVMDASGNLFGTTSSGGTNGFGTVYELTSTGGGAYSEQLLFNFTGAGDGANPTGGLLLDASGNLFGMNGAGGSGSGAVFELTPAGGVYNFRVLYTFTGAPDAAIPGSGVGLIMDAGGNLYGTTYDGGSLSNSGSVFQLAPDGSGGYTEKVLAGFQNGADGGYPQGTLLLDASGNLLGTTTTGGNAGFGTVFKYTLH